MAQLVLGIGTSHSPMLSMEPDSWHLRGESDRKMKDIVGLDGQVYTYDELLAKASPEVMKEITPEKFRARHEQNQKGIAKVVEALERAAPDVLVMVGDDQQELLQDDNMPAISVFWGESALLEPREVTRARGGRRMMEYTEAAKTLPVASGLGEHIIHYLIEAEFDVGNSRYLPEGKGISECFGYVYNRLMPERVIPTVPIWLNTYYPPSQPTPKRCYRLGQALRGAIEAWKGDTRVAILASGGLSHFAVDEELDQMAIQGMKDRDVVKLSNLPREKLNSGNSEIRNWITITGASEHLDLKWLDYVPCYRSPAGTGCAMGFAEWS